MFGHDLADIALKLERAMSDRTVNRCWWLTTILLITLTAAGALTTAYRGVFSAFAGEYRDIVVNALFCLPLGVASYLLARHRCDLVGD